MYESISAAIDKKIKQGRIALLAGIVFLTF